MNCLEIVLQGFFNENNREYLEKYFIREFKKAEKEQFFEANEYFNGCMKVVNNWENHLQKQVFERKDQLYLMLNEAKKGTLIFDNLEGKTIEQRRAEIIENCENELQNVRPDGIGYLTFTVNMGQLTNGRVNYHLTYKDISEIKGAINKAFEKTKIVDETPQELNNIIKSENKKSTFKNNFDNISEQEIFNHFKTSLVDKGYLNETLLIEYLKAAFELRTKPKILFKLKHTPSKDKIYLTFYTYYREIAQKPHGKQTEYAALLGEYFEGYSTELIKTNWARGYKTKR